MRKTDTYEQGERPKWGILYCDWCLTDASQCEIPEEHRENWDTYAEKVVREQTTEWSEENDS